MCREATTPEAARLGSKNLHSWCFVVGASHCTQRAEHGGHCLGCVQLFPWTFLTSPTGQYLILLLRWQWGHSQECGLGRDFRPILNYVWFQVAWVKWMDSSAPFTMMPDTNYCNIIVPTMDTMQMSYLLGMLLTNNKPVSAPTTPCPSPPQGSGSGMASLPHQQVGSSLCVSIVYTHLPGHRSPRCCALGQQARGRLSLSPTSFSRTCHWSTSATSLPSQPALQPTRPRTSLTASWTRGRTPLLLSSASEPPDYLNHLLSHLPHQIILLALPEMTQQGQK